MRQHYFSVEIPFLRGSFYTDNSIREKHPEPPQKMVFDLRKFHLHADTASIPQHLIALIAEQLTHKISTSLDSTTTLSSSLEKKGRSIRIISWLDPAVKERIENWWYPFAKEHRLAKNALFFVADYQRSYPYGHSLGQVLHTVQRRRDEITHQAIPTGGLELTFHSALTGKKGEKILMRSPKNRLDTGKILVEPENGKDIYLTINHCLQAIAEEELKIGVESTKSQSGWAVMMDPFSGKILAFAQYPFFDPSRYEEYFNDKEQIEHTRCRAITEAREPGSVMKPLTLAIALKANEILLKEGQAPLFDPMEPIATLDGSLPGRKPMQDVRPHKFLNMYQALQKSANIYMARLAERIRERLGDVWYRQQLAEIFGFGQPTNIELPGESSGMLPTPGKMLPNGKPEWSLPTPFSLAIGYNLQTTALQICRAYAVLANGGYLVHPTLIEKVEGQQTPLVEPQLVISKEVIQQVTDAMKYVTSKKGSGRRGAVGGYTEAAKSGTSRKLINGQYSKKHHTSSFCGFLPVPKPAFVLLVGLDEPEAKYVPGVGHTAHGGYAAAPIFREIARRSLNYLGIEPDDPHGYPTLDPRYDPEKADWNKEIEQMTEMYAEWNDEL